MSVVTPPRPPAPRRPDELDALLREARRRQRRRRVLVAAAVAVVFASGIAGLLLGARGSGGSPTTGSTAGEGAVADTALGTCKRISVPDGSGYVVFSGKRYAYTAADGGWTVWTGTLAGGEPHKFVPGYVTSPAWLGQTLALPQARLDMKPLLHLGGRTITLDLPASAELDGISASRGRILFHASWGNGPAGKLKAGTFIYAHGGTKEIRRDPEPYGGVSGGPATWSREGSRIAFFEDGDLWTMAADGSDSRRLTHTPTVSKGGPALWSPNGGTIVYQAVRARLREVYAVPASGGAATRLTHSTRASAPGEDPGTRPLAWLGPSSLAVVSGASLGMLPLRGGPVSRVCTLPLANFSNGSALR